MLASHFVSKEGYYMKCECGRTLKLINKLTYPDGIRSKLLKCYECNITKETYFKSSKIIGDVIWVNKQER